MSNTSLRLLLGGRATGRAHCRSGACPRCARARTTCARGWIKTGVAHANLSRVTTPDWTHEECVNYEVAREILTSLIGFRSLWIEREEALAQPDRSKIATWLGEMEAFARQQRGLQVTDRERVAQLRDEYGPIVKELVAAERARVA